MVGLKARQYPEMVDGGEMAQTKLRRALLLVCATQLALAGCSTPKRLPAVPVSQIAQATPAIGAVRFLVTRETNSFEAEARSVLAKEQQWLASQGQAGQLPPAYFLAISGGGDNGAYGAGFLNGWTAAGTRPEFKVVTGISTGALIAPFAFLGPKYDYVLRQVYTNTSQKDIFKKRGIVKGILGDAMADSRPLANTISTYVNRQLLDEIAAEYAKGRLLLVGTANLDSLEPVIWNMTAIAASKDPNATTLFSNVLLASASIPGAFPPVMIDVNVGGAHYQEMHADGGTMAQVFLYPPSLRIADAPKRTRVLYIIRNARLDADWASVERRTFSIATRAIASLTRTQGIGDLYRIYATAQRDGIDFNLTYIPPTFNVPHVEEFDTSYMRALYDVGATAANYQYPWKKYPPGFEAPPQATARAVEERR
jgi:predicted acylesterase/phospholipase RssA